MNIVSDYNPSQEPTPVYMKKKRTSTHIHNLHADLPIGHDWFRVFAVSVLFPFFVPATSTTTTSSVLGFLAPITTTTTTAASVAAAAADEGGFGAGEAGGGFDVFGLGVGEHSCFFECVFFWSVFFLGVLGFG